MTNEAAKVTEAFAQLADIGAQVIEAATGHREAALRAGYSETIAERMALEFHSYLLSTVAAATIAKVGEG